jgi:hypothetical protein
MATVVSPVAEGGTTHTQEIGIMARWRSESEGDGRSTRCRRGARAIKIEFAAGARDADQCYDQRRIPRAGCRLIKAVMIPISACHAGVDCDRPHRQRRSMNRWRRKLSIAMRPVGELYVSCGESGKLIERLRSAFQ